MVVDYDGRILGQADPGPGEKIVVAPIHIDMLRAERERRSGHDMRAHLRTGLHSYFRKEWLEPASGPIDSASIKVRIDDAKSRLKQNQQGKDGAKQ